MRSTAITALRPLRAHILRQPWAVVRNTRYGSRRLQSQRIFNPDGSSIRRQDVYFLKPSIFSGRRLGTLVLYSTIVYVALKFAGRYVDIEVAVEEQEETATEEGTPAEKDIMADEDSLFIPMTWAQKMPRTYYKGSDPEWKEFLNIAKDDERKKKMWNDLVTSFYKFASKTPSVTRQIGKLRPQSNHWLDITFPDGPPQEYIRSGLEFGDGFIAWSQQKITDQTQARLTRMLSPIPVLKATFETIRVMLLVQKHNISSALGFKSERSNNIDEKFAMWAKDRKMQQQRARLAKARTDPKDSAGTDAGSMPTGRQADDSSGQQRSSLWSLPSIHLPKLSERDDARDIKLQMALASTAFIRSLARYRSAATKLDPPRGTCIVHGLIELRGSIGRMQFEVKALYDPKQDKYVNIDASLKQVKKWKQNPRGGN